MTIKSPFFSDFTKIGWTKGEMSLSYENHNDQREEEHWKTLLEEEQGTKTMKTRRINDITKPMTQASPFPSAKLK